MFNERPSRSKVVGVSHKYLRYEENNIRFRETWEYLNRDDISVTDVYRAFWLTSYLSARQAVGLVLQARRSAFLRHERAAEGLAPGQERLAAYALAVTQSPDSYPRTSRTL